MSSPATRLFLQGEGASQVRDVALLAGANHGSRVAFVGAGEGAREMSPPYACGEHSLHGLQERLNGCLTDEGRTVEADETPGGVEDGGEVAYLSLYSTHDRIIQPVESSCLNMKRRNDCSDPVNGRVGPIDHVDLLLDREVFERVRAFLQARNRSRPHAAATATAPAR